MQPRIGARAQTRSSGAPEPAERVQVSGTHNDHLPHQEGSGLGAGVNDNVGPAPLGGSDAHRIRMYVHVMHDGAVV